MPDTDPSAAPPPAPDSPTGRPAYALVDRPEQPFVGVTRSVTMDTMSEASDEIPRLLRWLGDHGRIPAGAPFLRYLVIDMAATMVVQAGVPVDEPIEAADDDVEADTLPAGRYATTTHMGPYDGLYGATVGLLRWAGEGGLSFDKAPSGRGEAWVSRIECYDTNPVAEPDPHHWVTRLAFKLAD